MAQDWYDFRSLLSNMLCGLPSVSKNVLVVCDYRCLAYGILSRKRSEKLFAIVSERKKNGGVSSPAPKKKKAKIVKDEGIDPGIQESGPERVGSAVI